MDKSIGIKYTKNSIAKPNNKPPPRNKNVGFGPDIIFYEI